MISNVLMGIILGIFVLCVGCYLFYLMLEAIKYKDTFCFIVMFVANIVYWLTIIMLVFKYFGL